MRLRTPPSIILLLSFQLLFVSRITSQAETHKDSENEVKRVQRSVDEEESDFEDAEKRVFGSFTKPVGKHSARRQQTSREQPIQVSDMKRSDDDNYYELLEDLMNRKIESKRNAAEGYESYGESNGSPDDEREGMLRLALMEGEQDNDDDNAFEPYDKRPFGSMTGKINKRPFGTLTGRFGKRPFGSFTRKNKRPFGSMTGQVKKRPFGSITAGLSKRPFGSFTNRIDKKPFGSLSRVLNKRPFGSFSRPRDYPKRDDADVEKRPFGSFSRKQKFLKRADDDIEKRPFGSFTRWTANKRPFAPMHGVVGKRSDSQEGNAQFYY